LQLAVHYQRSNQNAEALRYYEEVMRLDPSDALVHMNIGRVSLRLNQLGRAEQAFKEVVRLAPDRPEGQDALGEVRAMINAKGKP
jgi:predicted Zn-dependent protease